MAIEEKATVGVSMTNCSVCDAAKLPYCIHKKKQGGGEESELDDDLQDAAEVRSAKEAYLASLSNIITVEPRDEVDVAVDFSNIFTTSKQILLKPNKSVKSVLKALEEFILALAERQGLDTKSNSPEQLAVQLGIAHQISPDGTAILITMQTEEMFYAFADKLAERNLITLTDEMQQGIDQMSSQANTNESETMNTENTFNPTPLATEPKLSSE